MVEVEMLMMDPPIWDLLLFTETAVICLIFNDFYIYETRHCVIGMYILSTVVRRCLESRLVTEAFKSVKFPKLRPVPH